MSTSRLRRGGQQGASTRRVLVARRWLLLGFALLTAVLVAFVGYQRSRARHFLADLPKHLGLDIRSETNGFTYTQSVKGKVLFTVHAAKAIQRENGKTTLHDVAITVHPRPGSDHPDSIRGEQFEYDQTNGIIQAAGVVHLDLEGPRSTTAEPHAPATRIAVTTSGLIYLQKLGVLATDQPLQIVYGDMHGSARGAEYETDTGLLRLRSDVTLDGTQQGKPVHLVAAAAEFDRTKSTGVLHTALVQIAGNRGRGDRMILTAGTGDGPRLLEAEGNVVLDTLSGEHLAASHMHAVIDGNERLQQISAQGNVALQDERYKATAGSALLHMDAAGRPQQAELTTAVHVTLAATAGQDSNELTAPHVVFNLSDVQGHSDLKEISADGGAVLTSVGADALTNTAPHSPLPGNQTSRMTTLAARSLHANTAVANGTRYISDVEGQGDTRLEQSDSLGNRRVSHGNTLRAVLLPATAAGAALQGQAALRTVVQTGNVDIVQHKVLPQNQASLGAAQSEDDHATAQRAEWDNALERLSLTGSPVLTGPGVQLAADTIELSQKTATSEAAGHVRGTFQRTSPGSTDPVRVLAERCRVDSGTGLADFFGITTPVRLWTSSSQLEAAQVSVNKVEGLLTAHGVAKASQPDVHLVLNEGTSSPENRTSRHGTIQVRGQLLTIKAANGQTPTRITTTGDARVIAAGSDVRAERVVATMNASQAPGSQSTTQGSDFASIMPGNGSLQSIVASGSVTLQQPGKTAIGQELVYTAHEDQFRLTGTHEKLASLHDSLHGDLRGLSLVFHGGDERAEVTGEAAQPVRTELPAPSGRPHR